MKSCACWPRATGTRRGRRGALMSSRRREHLVKGRAAPGLPPHLGRTIPQRRLPGILEPQGSSWHGERGLRVESLQGMSSSWAMCPTASCAWSRAGFRRRGCARRAALHSFWAGEAPGRTDELSASVSRLRLSSRRGWMRDSRRRRKWLAAQAASQSRCAAAVNYCRRTGRARGAADPADRQFRTLLRRGRRHAAGHSLAVRQVASIAPGDWPAQALLPLV